MLLLTVKEKKRYRDYFMIAGLGAVLGYYKGIGIVTGIGMLFVLFLGVDLIMVPFSHILARIMFTEVFPEKVEELKHDDKHYQYIVTTKGKTFYTDIYPTPQDKIKLRVFTIAGKYFVEVWR